MNIALLEIESKRKECINKDFMGGYGWAFNAGDSLPARMINFVKKRGEKLPIMAFGYLGAIFSEKGHSVEYAVNKIPDADIVIMQSSMVDHTAEMEWVDRLKAEKKTVGFIGPFSSALPDIFLKKCDFVIIGEPEGAAYRISEGLSPKGIIRSEPVANLDDLPFPKWELFPYKNFSYFPALKEKPFLPVLASRGCPFTCNYCPYPFAYSWKERSAENVLNEIDFLVDRFGMKAMLFRDPIFSLNRQRTEAIASGIIRRKHRIKWACETRLDKLDKDLLRLMRESGLRVLNVGIESGSEEVIRKASRKPVELAHQEEMISFCDRLGIRVTAFYMSGMPDDTEESLTATLQYAKKLNTHVAQFFIFTPFPGTGYYRAVQDTITEKNWERFDCYTPVFRHKHLSRDAILRLKEKAFVSYYYRPSWAFKFIQRAVRDIIDL